LVGFEGTQKLPRTKANQGESVHASSAESPVILSLNVPIIRMTRTMTRKRKKEKKKFYNLKKDEAQFIVPSWASWSFHPP
jgi:hypothetical protein